MTRDRRGYDTTSVVEAGGRRRRGQRLLYFFRTPPSVRVGREAIDQEAMRLLEQHNPDVTFDWERLIKTGSSGSPGSPVSSGSSGSPGSGAPGSSGSPSSPGSQGSPGSPGSRRRERREQRRGRTDFSAPSPRPAAVPADNAAPDVAAGENGEYPEPRAEGGTEPVEETAEPTEHPAHLEHPAHVEHSEHAAHPEHPEPLPERYARLGAAGLQRLRSRYADLSARLAAKTLEDEQRAELGAKAERLNPDGWLTAEDVAAAMEDYEATFESLRAIVGRQPRGRL